MDDVLKNRELVSALADGQLRGAEFARTVELVAADADAQAAWQAYHVVGDVLRSPEMACARSDSDFMARLNASLAREPVPARPVLVPTPQTAMADAIAATADAPRAVAANESTFRWKLVAGCASVAAVAAIGWNTAGSLNGAGTQPQMAQAQAQQGQQVQQAVNVAGTQQVMIRDPRLDELMSAHRQFGGTSALQMPAGFLRNATFEGPAR